MTTRLNPYLSFADNAREALEFYASVLGGTSTDRFGIEWLVNITA
jgi:PhnB protein